MNTLPQILISDPGQPARRSRRQTLITIRPEAKARLKTVLKHTPNARPMIDVVSDAIDAITGPHLATLGLHSEAGDHIRA